MPHPKGWKDGVIYGDVIKHPDNVRNDDDDENLTDDEKRIDAEIAQSIKEDNEEKTKILERMKKDPNYNKT